MRALIVKEFRELARDRRTLAMLIALPIVLLVVFGYAANFSVDRVTVIIVGPGARQMEVELRDSTVAGEDLEVLRADATLGADDARDLLRDQQADAVLVAPTPPDQDDQEPLSQRMHAVADGSNLFTAQAVQRAVLQLAAEDAQERAQDARAEAERAVADAQAAQGEVEAFVAELAEFQAALQQALRTGAPLPDPPPPPEGLSVPEIPEFDVPALDPEELVTVLFNPDLRTSWVMVPGLIGLILLFIGVLITSIGLVRERETGTLEQLAVMPLRPASIILGKILPYFALAVADMSAVTALGVWLFDVPFSGSLWLFAASALVFLFVVLGIGVLISSVSQTTGQSIQMAIFFVVPQILLSGLIFPLDSMPVGVRWIGYLLPLTWFRELAQGIMLRDAGLDSLWPALAVLGAMAVFAFGAATARMRRALTHGGAL